MSDEEQTLWKKNIDTEIKLLGEENCQYDSSRNLIWGLNSNFWNYKQLIGTKPNL